MRENSLFSRLLVIISGNRSVPTDKVIRKKKKKKNPKKKKKKKKRILLSGRSELVF